MEEKTERRIKVTERRGRRRKQLLAHLKETILYWNLKEEALYHTHYITHQDILHICACLYVFTLKNRRILLNVLAVINFLFLCYAKA